MTRSNASRELSRRRLLTAAGAMGVGAAASAGTPGTSSRSVSASASVKTDNQPSDYDYIIIGGGTAGPVLAARLTEDPTVTVLMLEAGPENTIEGGAYAAGVGMMWGPQTNWSYNSTPQDGLGGRQIMQPRGKVIGGSAAINVGSWSRGTRGNYESWSLPGWDWETIVGIYKKIEASRRPNQELRGQSGRMRLEDTPAGTDMTAILREAAIQAGVGTTEDRNAEDPTGFDIWETIFPGGRRWNTEHGYLETARNRSNLTVATEAFVSRINFEGKRAKSVSYSQGGQDLEVHANREVLLCAGTINSPQLLMLSGIGPAAHLQAHGIDVVQDLPGVGANLADHVRVNVGALTPQGVGETLYPNPNDPEQLAQWRAGNYGPLTVAENTSSAFLHSDEGAPHPDIELMYAINPSRGMHQENPERAGWYIMVGLVLPKSRGSVSLASANAMDKPVYDPAYLSDPEDLQTYIKGVRIALAHVETDALSPYTDRSTLNIALDADDAAIESHIRSTAESIYHPVGSVKMGVEGDPMAALDPQCRVRGIDGLRVVDASAIPTLISGHTMAPTIMIAERVASFIKEG